MPISADDLKALEKALGDDAELLARIKQAQSEDITALDGVKGQLKALDKAKVAAEKAAEAAKADLDKARSGESEQAAKLTAERDAIKAELEKTQADHKTYRIRSALEGKLRESADDKPGITDSKRLAAAMKVLGMPEGVDLDDQGNLVGAEEHLKSLRADHGYFFGEVAQGGGHGGSRSGAKPLPGGGTGGGAKTEAEQARERGRQAALASLTPSLPAGLSGGTASGTNAAA